MQMLQCNANANDTMRCMTLLLPTRPKEGVRAVGCSNAHWWTNQPKVFVLYLVSHRISSVPFPGSLTCLHSISSKSEQLKRGKNLNNRCLKTKGISTWAQLQVSANSVHEHSYVYHIQAFLLFLSRKFSTATRFGSDHFLSLWDGTSH